MSRSDHIEEVAARWLIRQEDADWTASDEAAFDAWLSETPEHKVAVWRLRDSWTKGDRLASRRGAVDANARPIRPRRAYRPFVGLAAAVLAAICVAPFLPFPAGERFQTDTGVQQTVRLADGSRVELNTATRLRADLGGERREVWLDAGEAFFEVQHDAARPFIVHAGSRNVTVLGTRFSVRRDGDQVRVVVLEGRVRFDERGTSQGRESNVLTAGAIVNAADSGVMIRQATPERVMDDLSWRAGVLVFDQVTLAEAVAEFNRYNKRQLVIDDPAVSDIRIGGRLQAHSIDGFARLLQRTYGLRIETEGDRVLISE